MSARRSSRTENLGPEVWPTRRGGSLDELGADIREKTGIRSEAVRAEETRLTDTSQHQDLGTIHRAEVTPATAYGAA